jgi:uncharacterized membrane protein YphA (DoxX/SURF4 family)
MGTAVLVLRACLALVFMAAAFGKLRDLPGSRRAVESFGVPRQLVGVTAIVLPCAESIIAIALLVQQTAQASSLAALLLLAIFVAAIGRLIHRGIAAECHCFGQLHSSAAGWPTLLRNLALAAVAGAVVVAGPGRSIASLSGEGAGLLATSLTSVVLAVAVASLWRENRALRARRGSSGQPVEGLPKGTVVPDLMLRSLDDSPVSVRNSLVPGKSAVLVQVGLGCAPCHDLMPELVRWNTVLSEELTIIIVSSGELEANRAFAAQFEASGLLVSPDGEFGAAFQLDITPSAVRIDGRGRVAALPALGAGAIEALVRSVRHEVNSATPVTSRSVV